MRLLPVNRKRISAFARRDRAGRGVTEMDKHVIVPAADGRCVVCGQPLYRRGNRLRIPFGFGAVFADDEEDW